MNEDRWNVELVATYLGLTPKHTRDAVIKKPDFPKPVVNASRRTRLWNAEDVKQWAAKPH